MSRLAAPVSALLAIGAAFAYVGAVDPNEPGHYPVCPFLYATGLYCPGCGGLRSAHALVHGEPLRALGANALGVAAMAAGVVVLLLWAVQAARGRPVTAPLRRRHWWALGAVALAFTVVRNLPVGAALAP